MHILLQTLVLQIIIAQSFAETTDTNGDDDVTAIDKRSADSEEDYDIYREAMKRYIDSYRYDLGKRSNFRYDLGKRSNFRYDLGKRSNFRYDLGKRDDVRDALVAAYGTADVNKRANFRYDLGKRASFGAEEEKRGFRTDLGKRAFGNELGKRYRYDLGKRGSFRTDLGKR